MVNRLPLLIGIVLAALLIWGYTVTVDSAFFGAALDGADRLSSARESGTHDRVPHHDPHRARLGPHAGRRASLPHRRALVRNRTGPVHRAAGRHRLHGGERPHRAHPFDPAGHTGRALVAGDHPGRLPARAAGIRRVRARRVVHVLAHRRHHRRPGAAGRAAVRARAAAAVRFAGVLPALAARRRGGRHHQRGRIREGTAHGMSRPAHRPHRLHERRLPDQGDLRGRLPLRRRQHPSLWWWGSSPSRR